MPGITPPPPVEPRGMLDSAESTAAQSGITTATDLTGLSIDFTVVEGRPVKVRLVLPWVLATVADTHFLGAITDASGTQKSIAGGTVRVANTGPASVTVEERITVAGDYTRKGQLARNGGTGTLANNYPGGAATVISRIEAIEVLE